MVSELDALGDELLLDDDSSYLDEASAAPSIPEGIPSDSKTNKVTDCGSQCSVELMGVESHGHAQKSVDKRQSCVWGLPQSLRQALV